MTDLIQYVKEQEGYYKSASPEALKTWEKESQFAIQSLQKNEFLAKTATNNLPSLQNAIINVSAIGISLNPASKHAYLVPRDKQVSLDISYIGLMHLAVTSGAIQWGQAKLVYSNDQYTNNGIDKAPTHTQDTFGNKGNIVGVYCTVKLKNGDYMTEEMDMDAINKVKATSKAADSKYSPWKTFPEEMIRKTVVKRASKYWHCEPLQKAVEVINEHEGLSNEYTQTVSAPKIESYTDEQKEYFDKLIENKDGVSLAVLKITNEELYISLTGSFPHGQKGKFGEILMGLCRNGYEALTAFESEFFNAAGDDTYTNQLIDDLDNRRALEIILSRLDSEVEMYIRSIINQR